jgi:NADH:ubiquinone oxidoreductase 27 kD subunit
MFANLQTAETLNLELKLHKTDDDLWIDSIVKEFPSANWYERELSEMFGIKVMGRSAKRLLLENWNGTEYPLRKEFVWGNEYKKVE